MLTYRLGSKNKYYSLYYAVREDILHGVLKAGEKLPGKRPLAAHLGVSVITVQTAYEQLLAEGYIYSSERRGYFVAEVNAGKFADPAPCEDTGEGKKEGENYVVDLSSGRAPAPLFPFSVWAKLMRETLSEEGEHLLERVPCDGLPMLKSAISAYLYRFRGYKVNPRYIIIGAGAEYLYGVIVQLLGRDRPYAVENPGYKSVSGAYRLNGARCEYIPVGEKGADVNCVEKSGACALHVSPSHQYPTGAIIPAANRSRLLAWAERNNSYVIEDDYDSEFRLFGKPLQPVACLNADRVIYINTFSKTLAPSMRLGYMVLPPALYKKYRGFFGGFANVVPLFEQITLAKMLNGGYFERHVNRLKNHYRSVREEILRIIVGLPVEKKVIETGGGLHLTLRLPAFGNDLEIKRAALKRGVKIECLSDYLFTENKGDTDIAIVNYSSLTLDDVKKLKSLLC